MNAARDDKRIALTEKQQRSLDAFVKLNRAADSINARIHREIYKAGLTHSQFGVLDALYHCGSMSQRELAGKILKSTGNISTVLANMEKRSLISRQQDEADRRVQIVHLCGEGRQLFESLFVSHVERIENAFSPLAEDRLDLFSTLCREVGLHAADDEQWPASDDLMATPASTCLALQCASSNGKYNTD